MPESPQPTDPGAVEAAVAAGGGAAARTVAVVTVARSDYGIYRSVLRAIDADPALELEVYCTGMHLAPEFGLTVRMVEGDGFPVTEKVESLIAGDTPSAIAKSTGIGVAGFADVFARRRPDILVVLGDRFDMFAPALAALPFKIPVAHLHGGEVTHGAFDEALRHSLTKISHLHFAATEDAARRVVQLGEEPWRVTVSGAPALDALDGVEPLSKGELCNRFGLDLDEPPLLVTFHPVTLEFEQAERQVGELLAAVAASGKPAVFTAPNADTAGRRVREMVEAFVAGQPRAYFVENFGHQAYTSMMREALVMVGNSSSGIIEAASFGLPVVNIGERQGGRFRGGNVIDTGYGRDEILAGIERASGPDALAAASAMENPYRAPGGKSAAAVICARLREVELGDRLVMKRFHDLEPGPGRGPDLTAPA